MEERSYIAKLWEIWKYYMCCAHPFRMIDYDKLVGELCIQYKTTDVDAIRCMVMGWKK